MSDVPVLPAWVHKRDGRLVPFEADKISQTLFAAGESLGHPDAFLARELTDGILHFLAQESSGSVPTTAGIAELVATIVRELGQPALALAFTEERKRRAGAGAVDKTSPLLQFQFAAADAPAAVVRACLRQYSLNAVFSRDLGAAQNDGLLTLTGLENPLELAGGVLDLSTAKRDRADQVFQAVAEARQRFGSFLVLDSPERWLAASGLAPDRAADFLDNLCAALAANHLEGIVNLNCAQAPAWAEAGIAGPLFDARNPVSSRNRVSAAAAPAAFLDELLDHWPALKTSAACLRLHWHLGDADLTGATNNPRLLRLLQTGPLSPGLSFTFDRPRQPIGLAEGADRRHPAVLITIGLHLPRLLDLPGVAGHSDKFLGKLASLARMAVSAAVQKRNFLRRRPELAHLRREFFLDRARLVAVPLGLEATLRLLTGAGPDSKAFVELGRQALGTLRESLRNAGAAANLDTAIANPHSAAGCETGLTPDCPSPRSQIKIAAALQSAAGGGTVSVVFPEGSSPAPPELIDLLQLAWRSNCTRLRFRGATSAQQELQLQSLA